MPTLEQVLPGMLERAADPAAARRGWERLQSVASAAVRQALGRDAALAEALLAIFSVSEHLSETLLQAPDLVLWLDDARRQNRGRNHEDWTAALDEFTRGLGRSEGERAQALARFQRREYLRIVLRDLHGDAALAETTQELSHLADALLERAYTWAWNDLAERFGTPQESGGGGAEMAILGLGKLGGEELNYSSDIDLMFLYSAPGTTAGGAAATTNREFFSRLAQSVVQYVSRVTAEGRAYRVDLRLRPGGREGEMVLPLASAAEYYRGPAREWELQMLIRGRGCAGSAGLAQRFLAEVAARVYPARPDEAALTEAVRESRRRIQAEMERHRALGRRRGLDVKLDAGGIRDIEFLTQALQRQYGGTEPWVRAGNTRVGLQRLLDKGHLGGPEFQALSAAYELLRSLEHRLQLRMGQQTHTVPDDPARQLLLERSLGLAAGELPPLLARHMTEVARLYARHVGFEGAGAAAPTSARTTEAAEPPRPDLDRHGQRQWARLQRSLATIGAAPLRVAASAEEPLGIALERSDWMAEALIRRPELVATLGQDPGGLETTGLSLEAGMAQLRRWRQRQLLELLAREWEERRPIADTLAGISELALAVIAAALELAQAAAPQPAPSLAVLGLGRLGLRELDLLSDLDLVFVAEEGEREAAARVAAKLIEVLTAYTSDGSLYAVDARLRPSGGEGELVQTPGSLESHFGTSAGLWEAASYLKARAIAGDPATAAAAKAGFETGVHGRFVTAEATAGLRRLRDRIEREGRPGRWGLKTAAGGYYDVDFLHASRRLRPALPRLPPELSGLTTLLRAGDHALRAATGKAGSALPASGGGVGRAQAWLRRIWPEPMTEPLEAVLDGARARVRAIFDASEL